MTQNYLCSNNRPNIFTSLRIFRKKLIKNDNPSFSFRSRIRHFRIAGKPVKLHTLVALGVAVRTEVVALEAAPWEIDP